MRIGTLIESFGDKTILRVQRKPQVHYAAPPEDFAQRRKALPRSKELSLPENVLFNL
jgi:hypothetical protein